MRSNRFIAGILALSLVSAQARELRVYMIGNSLTDNVNYDGFRKLAESRGHTHTWGRSMTPGAPIFWHWTHEPTFTQPPFGPWKKALAEYPWDAVTLQPFSTYTNELVAAKKFLSFIEKKNAAAQVFIYAQWMTRDKGDFDVAWTQPGGTAPGTRDYYERFVLDLRAACPNMKPCRIIPVGHAMYLLNQKIKAGQVPGFRDIREVYNDGIHLNNIGAYIAGLSFFATLYGETPIGLPAEPYQPQPGHRGSIITSELARIIQETVWETVATHPLSGVTSKTPVKIASPILPDAVQGRRYEFALLPAFGSPPYKWSLADGQLPAGLTLGSDGVIRGTALTPGESKLVFQVNEAKRELTLRVVADTKPEITDRVLPPGRVGRFYRHPLRASGGNGPLTWRPSRKELLPPGLELQINGELVGTPVRTGEFTFPVEVLDSEDVATAKITFTATEADKDVLFVKKIASKSVMVDGKLDEPFWRLEHPIAKLVDGRKTELEASFDVATDGENLYVAIASKTPGSRRTHRNFGTATRSKCISTRSTAAKPCIISNIDGWCADRRAVEPTSSAKNGGSSSPHKRPTTVTPSKCPRTTTVSAFVSTGARSALTWPSTIPTTDKPAPADWSGAARTTTTPIPAASVPSYCRRRRRDEIFRPDIARGKHGTRRVGGELSRQTIYA